MKYYCIGIKGSGMSTLANILSDLGHEVSGYDDARGYKFTEEEYYMDSIFFTSDMCLDLADFEKMIDGHFYDFTLA